MEENKHFLLIIYEKGVKNSNIVSINSKRKCYKIDPSPHNIYSPSRFYIWVLQLKISLSLVI